MPGTEFEIIERYFSAGRRSRDDVILGIGDDGAVLRVPEGKELVVSIDTLISEVHFPEDTDPSAIGYKAMAVNLSDMAAMGAEPAWATLSLTLPEANHEWLKAFSRGFFELADQFNVQLVGGDTCRAPLPAPISITVQLHGFVNAGEALRRDTARPGDLIYVTGTLGDAGLALAIKKGEIAAPQKGYQYLLQRFDRPSPRINEGLGLHGVVHAVIDLSDGLVSDLGHILDASRVGATVYVDKIPVSPVFESCKKMIGTYDNAWIDMAISSGDDYELCFTMDPRHRTRLAEKLKDTPFTCIGEITMSSGMRCILENGKEFIPASTGYDHFK